MNRTATFTAAAFAGALISPAMGELVANYSFDEGSGLVAANSVVASGGDGVVGANVSFVTGVSGTGVQLGGGATQADIVDMGNATGVFDSIVANGAFTMSVWLKLDAAPTTNRSVAVFMGNDTDSNDYSDIGLFGNSNIGDLGADGVYGRTRANSNTNIGEIATTSIADGQWHHVMLSVDDNTGTGAFYVDGVLIDEVVDAVDWELPTLLNNLEVGRLGRSSPVDAYAGAVDELQIYDTALGQSAATFLANNPGGVVPEPGSLALLGLGGLAMLKRRRRA